MKVDWETPTGEQYHLETQADGFRCFFTGDGLVTKLAVLTNLEWLLAQALRDSQERCERLEQEIEDAKRKAV